MNFFVNVMILSPPAFIGPSLALVSQPFGLNNLGPRLICETLMLPLDFYDTK